MCFFFVRICCISWCLLTRNSVFLGLKLVVTCLVGKKNNWLFSYCFTILFFQTINTITCRWGACGPPRKWSGKRCCAPTYRELLVFVLTFNKYKPISHKTKTTGSRSDTHWRSNTWRSSLTAHRLKWSGSAAGHWQRSRVQASMGQRCSGSVSGTNTMLGRWF